MFFDGSRYLKVKEHQVVDPGNGDRQVTVKRSRGLSETDFGFEYVVQPGDRLDLLAFRFYRTPRKWWLICDANPDLMYPDDLLEPGRKIVIPKDRTV